MNEKLAKIRCFMLDLDGTICLGGRAIDGAAAAVERMRRQGKVLFLTNNSSASCAEYAARLRKMGIAATEDDVYTSTLACSAYLNANFAGKRAYLFADDSVKADFVAAGVTPDDERPDVAVLAFRLSSTYADFRKFCDFVRAGVPYVATHDDVNCPTEDGCKPDVGAFLALIEKSTGVRPLAVTGKPYPTMTEAILSRYPSLKPHEFAMFGDRLYTDMRFAAFAGFTSVLVLTGEATTADLASFDGNIDVILPSIADWDK